MDKESIYHAWAPRSAVWSPWVKPVLFAREPMPIPPDPTESQTPDVSWLASFRENTALLFDLPGDKSVVYGIAAARCLGFRPVPLFASNPPDAPWMPAMVSTQPLRVELHRGAKALTQLALPDAAPPAFLTDAMRRAPTTWEVPVNTFDNRSAIFGSDFPSAEYLHSCGIRRCVIVREPTIPVCPDLAYSLLGWRKAGIEFVYLTAEAQTFEFAWPAIGFWGQLVHRLAIMLTLRSSLHGGYGRFVPESSGG